MLEQIEDFQLEKEMTPLVASWFKNLGYFVKKEFVTQEGICDLVACKFNEENSIIRRNLGLTYHLSNDIQVQIWTLLAVHPQDAGEVLKKFTHYHDNEIILKEIDKLKTKKFISEDESSKLFVNRSWFPLVDKVISVELKLQNFNEALAQAIRYQRFSKAYIGMPLSAVKRLSQDKLDVLTDKGIGLISVSPLEVNIVLEARDIGFGNKSNLYQAIRISEIFWKESSKTI